MTLPRMLMLAILAVPSLPVSADMLFHAPAERARITAERRAMLAEDGTSTSGTDAAATAASDTKPASLPAVIRLEGVSLPVQGQAYAWIGGRRYRDGDRIADLRLRVRRDGVQLIGAKGPGRVLRVGEAIPALGHPVVAQPVAQP